MVINVKKLTEIVTFIGYIAQINTSLSEKEFKLLNAKFEKK